MGDIHKLTELELLGRLTEMYTSPPPSKKISLMLATQKRDKAQIGQLQSTIKALKKHGATKDKRIEELKVEYSRLIEFMKRGGNI